MTTQFNLKKESERVQFVLNKRNLPTMRASVGLTLDVSGSMRTLFTNGTVQRLVEQIIPVALRADDNGNLDVYTFSDEASAVTQVAGATEKNYQGFVRREILDNSKVDLWNGTDYQPVLDKMLKDYGFYKTEKKGFLGSLFGNSEPSQELQSNSASGEAVINYFITDGENNDKNKAYNLLKKMQDAKCNMYVLFVALGDANFSFIEKCANDFGNVGFVNVNDLTKFVNADDIYEQLLPEELCNWVRQKQVIKVQP